MRGNASDFSHCLCPHRKAAGSPISVHRFCQQNCYQQKHVAISSSRFNSLLLRSSTKSSWSPVFVSFVLPWEFTAVYWHSHNLYKSHVWAKHPVDHFAEVRSYQNWGRRQIRQKFCLCWQIQLLWPKKEGDGKRQWSLPGQGDTSLASIPLPHLTSTKIFMALPSFSQVS